ncbi:hypothetical protein B7463_g8865, partial [Scytalidium lignicola]
MLSPPKVIDWQEVHTNEKLNQDKVDSKTSHQEPTGCDPHQSCLTADELLSQTSSVSTFERYLISHFIVSFAKKQKGQLEQAHWMYSIPDYVDKFLVVKCSIRAATMAFYGSFTRHGGIQAKSDQWYRLGLERYRLHIQRYVGLSASSYELPGEEIICAALMFAYFELARRKPGSAWLQHYVGAVNLLELRGLEYCQTGIGHSYFLAVRLGMAWYSILELRSSQLASEIWCKIPFEVLGKSLFDNLIDIILSIPKHLQHYEFASTSDHACNISTMSLLMQALSNLDHWWLEFGNLLHMNAEYVELLKLYRQLPVLGANERQHDHINPQDCRSIFHTAMTLALYHCTRIVILSAVCSVLSQQGSFGQGNVGLRLMMILPLQVVAVLSSCSEQNKNGKKILKKMGWLSSDEESNLSRWKLREWAID